MFDMREVDNYMDLISSKSYKTTYDELIDKKSLKKLTDLQLELLKKKYVNHENDLLHRMPTSRTVDVSMQILRFMMDSKVINDKIDNIPNMVITKGGNNPYDGSFCEIANKKYLMFETIAYLEAIPTLIHEATHYITPDEVTPNFHQTEILPIANELIGTDLLDELKLSDEIMILKNLETRLYHIKQRLMEKIEVAEDIERCTSKENLTKLKLIYEVKSQMLYTYLTSFIYSYGLYKQYILSGDDVLYSITDTISQKDNVSRLINRYELNLNETNSIKEVSKLIKRF